MDTYLERNHNKVVLSSGSFLLIYPESFPSIDSREAGEISFPRFYPDKRTNTIQDDFIETYYTLTDTISPAGLQ